MTKEKWIEEILQAGKQITPVVSNPYLASRIDAKLKTEESLREQISLRWIYFSASAMLLLITMNVLVWKSNVSKTHGVGIELVVHEYSFSGDDFYSFDYSK